MGIIKGNFDKKKFVSLVKSYDAPTASVKAEKPTPEGPSLRIEKDIPGLKDKKLGETFEATIKCKVRAMSDKNWDSKYTLEITDIAIGS